MTGLWADRGPYERWAQYLEQWAQGAADLAAPAPLTPADLPVDAWQRLLDRVDTAVSDRLQRWADALAAALAAAYDGFTTGRALAQARDGLREVLALTRTPGLPADFSARLAGAVAVQVERVQHELEAGVDRAQARDGDARWLEIRRRAIRDNPLTAVLGDQDAPERPAAPPWSYRPAGGTRRVVP